ncbi:MAG: hypothetical protein AB1512_24870 [Thermodesulfobacteriota bacterium]
MIRREHIKQAIDSISRSKPEIGYTLDEMLGIGLIDVPPADESPEEENFFFTFEGQKVLVNRVLFFNEGIVPIEQGLLVKYGELVKKQDLQERGITLGYQDAFREIHRAGLRTAVLYEIDHALYSLGGRLEKLEREGRPTDVHRDLVDLLQGLKLQEGTMELREGGQGFAYLYKGIVDADTPAYFGAFPYSMTGLMQLADINVEFFHLRFVLNCLLKGVERNLLTCVAENSIVGLIFLSLREQFLTRDLEIKYLATVRGKIPVPGEAPRRALKGVGTFLVAGVWMLLKNHLSRVKDIVLDSEAGARGFYESVGFVPRGMSGYVLREPRPYLLKSILGIASSSENLERSAVKEIQALIRRQVKALRKAAKRERAASERKAALSCIRECLRPGARPEYADAALKALLKYRMKIPEAEGLIRMAGGEGFGGVRETSM